LIYTNIDQIAFLINPPIINAPIKNQKAIVFAPIILFFVFFIHKSTLTNFEKKKCHDRAINIT